MEPGRSILSLAPLSTQHSIQEHRIHQRQSSVLSCWRSDYLPQSSIGHSRRSSNILSTTSSTNMSRKQSILLPPSRRLSLCQASESLVSSGRRKSCLPMLENGPQTIEEGQETQGNTLLIQEKMIIEGMPVLIT